MEGDQRHKEIKGIVLNDGNVVEGKIIKMSADATVMIQAEDGRYQPIHLKKKFVDLSNKKQNGSIFYLLKANTAIAVKVIPDHSDDVIGSSSYIFKAL